MTYSTEIVKQRTHQQVSVPRCGWELIREEIDTLGDSGQLLERVVTFFNEKGQKASERVAGLEKDGTWTDNEAVWTYRSDGSQVVDSRIVYTKRTRRRNLSVHKSPYTLTETAKGRGERAAT